MKRLTACMLFALVPVVAILACRDSSDPLIAQEPRAAEVRVPGAERYEALSDRALLIAVLTRLDSLEARLEHETQAAQTQLDALLRSGNLAALAPPVDPQRAAGVQSCLEIGVGSEGEHKLDLTALGNAFAGIGAWAGTGATANAKAKGEVKARLTPLKGAIALKKTWCVGRSVSQSSNRTSAARGAVNVQAPPTDPHALDSQIDAALNQFGIDDALASRATSQLSSMAGGLPACSPRDCARSLVGTLPIPGDLRNMLTDPQGFFRARSRDISDFTLDLLCGGVLDGPFRTRIDQACSLQNRVMDTQGIFDVYDAFASMPNLVDRIDERLAAVCDRARTLIDGVNDFKITKHSIFTADIPWPAGQVTQLGTNCAQLSN